MSLRSSLLKSAGSFALAAVLAIGQIPAFSISAAWADDATAKDFTEADFEALGFKVSEDTAPDS